LQIDGEVFDFAQLFSVSILDRNTDKITKLGILDFRREAPMMRLGPAGGGYEENSRHAPGHERRANAFHKWIMSKHLRTAMGYSAATD
jgi:hypothetical protein